VIAVTFELSASDPRPRRSSSSGRLRQATSTRILTRAASPVRRGRRGPVADSIGVTQTLIGSAVVIVVATALVAVGREREVGKTLVVEGDDLAVEHEPGWQVGQLEELHGHVPAAAAVRAGPSSVDTIARKPSHFTSHAQPLPLGTSPLRASIGRRPTVER
jgi:hypothetical protein